VNDYIIFTVGGNFYALQVASIQRIVQVPSITPIPNAHPFIEGMLSYENKVSKVVNFRQMMALPPHEEEISTLFVRSKEDHVHWVKALRQALEEDHEFTLTYDPHACRFGQWLDSYSTHDEKVLNILKVLRPMHAKLHEKGREIMAMRENDPKKAMEMFEADIGVIFNFTTSKLDEMTAMSSSISGQMQKLLIYQRDEEYFGIKVDKIEDIVKLDSSMLKHLARHDDGNAFVELEGVAELSGRLVNVIKSVFMPIKE
jgi:chemotaxis signal transduction protein